MTKDLYSENGVCLIPKGTLITEDLERKVKRFRLRPICVEIFDDSIYVEEVKNFEDNIFKREMSQELSEAYTSAKQDVKDVIDTINSGNKLNIKCVDKALDSIQTSVKDSFDVLKCIDSVRSVDEYTYAHCVNVSLLAMTLARWSGFSQTEIDEIAKAGLLHDVGKAKIPLELLNKNSSLLKEEFEEVKKHVTLSYRMVESMDGISRAIKIGILMHHEREDGSGYPMGAKNDQIHKYAKVLAIADTYDAMTSNKIYRSRRSVFDVLKTLSVDLVNQLDRKIVNIFVERIISHYIGDYVVLNTGETGQLVHVNPRALLKPIVKVDTSMIDLSMEADLELSDLLWDYSQNEF